MSARRQKSSGLHYTKNNGTPANEFNTSCHSSVRDRPLKKLWGWGRGIFEPQGFFSYKIPFMNIFLGLIGVQEFFFI